MIFIKITIRSVVILCLLSIFSVLKAENPQSLQLSSKERTWLHNHSSVHLGFNPDMQPLLIQNADGKITGILPEIFKKLETISGLKFNISIKSWPAVIKEVENRKIDGFLSCVPLLAKAKGLLSTKGYLPAIPIVYAKRTAGFKINQIEDLKGKRVVHLKGVKLLENVLAPIADEIDIITPERLIEAMTMVLEGKADVVLGINYDMYHLTRNMMIGIEPVFVDTSHEVRTVTGIRSDWPELVSILDKSLELIGEASINEIVNKWIHFEVVSPKISLTENERAWLRTHPVVELFAPTNLEPYSFIDEAGQARGITVDFLELLENELGVKIKTNLIHDSILAKKIISGDIYAASYFLEPEKFSQYSPSFPYSSLDLGLFVKKGAVDKPFIIKNFTNKKIGMYKGVDPIRTKIEALQKNKIVYFNSVREGLKAVLTGEVDAWFDTYQTGNYFINKDFLQNLEAIYIDSNIAKIQFHIRNDHPVLLDILNKAIETFKNTELFEIQKKWITILGIERIHLTEEEQTWLKAHPKITLAFTGGFEVSLARDKDGNYSGLLWDYLQLVNARSGANIQPEIFEIKDGIQKILNREVDGALAIKKSISEKLALIPTDPYYHTPVTIYTWNRIASEIRGYQSLNNRIVAINENALAQIRLMKEQAPGAEVVYVNSTLEGMKLVFEQKVDAFLSFSLYNYMISKYQLVGIVPAFTDMENLDAFTFGIRNDWPELISILNKTIASITETEHNALLKEWSTTDHFEKGEQKDNLTTIEQSWLSLHPAMRLGIDPSWAPVEYYDSEGKLSGITSDNIRILSQKMGIRIDPIGNLSWKEVLQQARQGKIDLISAIAKNEERAEYLLFTKPYLKLPMVIVTRDDAPVILGIQDLQGKTIAVIEDYITHSYLKRDFPDQHLLLFETLNEALQAVAKGKADAVIENTASINLAKNELGLTQLIVAATTPYAYELSMGVRKDWPELIPILEKGLTSITEREKQIIKEKWVNIRFQKQIDWLLIIWISLSIVLIAGSIIIIFFLWNRKLKNEIGRRKKVEVELRLNEERLEVLLKLSQMKHITEEQLIEFALEEGVRITGSENGYFHFVNPDQINLSLTAWSKNVHNNCNTEQNQHYPIENTEIWGDCILTKKPEIHNDCTNHSKRKGLLESHGVRGRHLCIPIIDNGLVVLVAGVGSKRSDYTDSDTKQLMLIMQNTWGIIKQNRSDEKLVLTQSTMDSASDAIFWLDKNARFTYLNKASCSYLGYSEDELLSMTVHDIDPNYPKEIWPEFWEKVESQGTMLFESMLQKKNGHTFPVEITLNLIDFPKSAFAVCYLRDITERKKANEELKLAKEKAETANKELTFTKFAFDNAPDAILWLELENARMTYVNNMAGKMLAYSQEEMLKLSVFDFDPIYNKKHWPTFRRSLRKRVQMTFESTWQRKDKLEFPVEISARFLNYNGIDYCLAVIRDVSDKNQAQKELQDAKEAAEAANRALVFTKFAFDNAPDAIEWLHSKTADMVYVNLQAGKMLDYSQDELMKMSVFDFDPVYNRDKWPDFHAELRRQGHMTFESVWQNKVGNKFPVEVSARSLKYEGEEYFLAFIRDISEKKQVQDELQKAKEEAEAANRAKSDFLSAMSHELRTPLNAILGYSQLFQRDTDLSADQKSKIDIINQSGAHLLALINDILDLAKIESGRSKVHFSNFNLHEFIRTMESSFRLRAEEKGLDLEFSGLSDTPEYIRSDKRKLQQILFNLISNAVKFTDQGNIWVGIGLQAKKPAVATLQIEVKDTGPGIDEQEMQNLFNAFEQTRTGLKKGEGTGLGLMISQQFAQLLGGTLTVSSNLDKGSTFTLKIDVSIVEKAESEESTSSRTILRLTPGQRSIRILVVEDNANSRTLLKDLLTIIGFEVETAKNGLEGVEQVTIWQPDLVFMDMRMPEMDGYEATRKIKSSKTDTIPSVVAITASVFEREKSKIYAAGCDDLIFKPYVEKEVLETIAKYIDLEYDYEEIQESNNVQTIETLSNVKAIEKTLSELPAELKKVLKSAAEELDQFTLIEVVEKIREQGFAELATYLEKLAKSFQFETIESLL